MRNVCLVFLKTEKSIMGTTLFVYRPTGCYGMFGGVTSRQAQKGTTHGNVMSLYEYCVELFIHLFYVRISFWGIGG